MIRLIYSNRTERLLARLAVDLASAREAAGPLAPLHLVVPNRNVETFVRFGLAQLTGLAANLRIHLLRSFLSRTVAGARKDLSVVEGATLQGLLLGILLDDEALAHPELQPVRAYLRAAGEAPDTVDLRRFQLAMQLSHLFEEYSYARPDMLAQWPQRTVVPPGLYSETEVWQRRLWLMIFGPEGLLERRTAEDGIRRLSMPALVKALGDEDLKLPGRIHFFGLSYVARVFQEVFARLGERTDLHLYTLNPCVEFWDDVMGARALPGSERWGRRQQRRGEEVFEEEDPFGFLEERDTPALRLWGRPGRENVRLLEALTGCESEALFAMPGDEDRTLLEQLQTDILLRRPEPARPPEENRFAEDRSLQLFACPSIRRECEAVAGEIWRLVQEDGERAERREPLRFNEIAVIVAGRDRESYFSHLSAAFRETWDIPHNVVDLPFEGSSRVAEAASMLLALPAGRFSRSEILRLVTHPNVRARVPEADPDEWIRWCEELGIVHGGDHADHQPTYVDRDLLNWDQGLRRLALGAFLPGGKAGESAPFACGEDEYLPLESGSRQSAAARFSLLVRSLIADAKFAREAKLPLDGWAAFVSEQVRAYLGATSEEEERDLSRVRRAIHSLTEVELGEREVSYLVAHELLAARLGAESGSRGQHLADGVVIAPTRPMRAIPFRMIFVVGLGEGSFPAADRRNHLDLRLAQKRPGDVSVREQDKYLFLETLLCARERLYLSYVGRDPVTGDLLEPSSVVVELRQILRNGYLGEQGTERWAERLPLRRFDGKNFPVDADARPHPPEAWREHAALQLRESLHAALPEGATFPDAQRLEALLDGESRAALRSRLGLVELPSDGVEEADAPIVVSTSALRSFLECPLQGYARYVLRLADEEEADGADEDDEPFVTSRLLADGLLRKAFLEALAGGTESLQRRVEARYADAARLATLAGQRPLGVFGEVEERQLREVLSGWIAGVEGEGIAAAPRTHRFGPAQEDEEVGELHDPVVLEVELGGRRRVVHLVGRTQPVVPGEGSLLLERRKLAKGEEEMVRRGRSYLKALLDQVMLVAGGVIGSGTEFAALLVVAGGGSASVRQPLVPVTAEDAKAYLTGLVQSLLGESHAYTLPCEAVFIHRLQSASIAPVIERVYAPNFRPSPRSRYGPLRHPEEYPPCPDARAVIEARFGRLLRAMSGGAR